jgi:hypothetical protein
MSKQILKPATRAARCAAAGVLSLVGVAASAQGAAEIARGPVLTGLLEVTATRIRVTASAMDPTESAPLIGRTTVTATRLSPLAERGDAESQLT